MTKISPEKLGLLIVTRREELGFTQEELGEKTKINRQVIGRIEKKNHIPSINQLNSLMEVLGFDLTDITEDNEGKNIFVAMMGKAETSSDKDWLEDMVSMMLCSRKHTRIKESVDNAKCPVR